MNRASPLRTPAGRVLLVGLLVAAVLTAGPSGETRSKDSPRPTTDRTPAEDVRHVPGKDTRPADPGRTPSRSLPTIRLVATGGTISNRAGGRLTAGDLVDSVPALARYARPEVEQFSNVASGDLTLAQWLQLARRVNEAFAAEPDLAGVVVTSGTDTLEELAYFLNLTVRSPKPVVLVGAMRPPGVPGYDGAANLLAGFQVAADPASQGKGVLVVLNDEINAAAREVTRPMRSDSTRSRLLRVSSGTSRRIGPSIGARRRGATPRTASSTSPRSGPCRAWT